ncbi:MAG: fumarylacetoacetate hydrolase family protein [Motiliproteus sp.]
MRYQHLWANGKTIPFTPGKAVCVGRIYADHAKELNNPVPTKPLLFIKPFTSMTPLDSPLTLPAGEQACHFETELTVLIGKPLTKASPQQAQQAIAGIGLGLDLTLRGLQDELKKKGHPWELAKAFDNSCPLSAFVEADSIDNIEDTEYKLWLNGELRQHGKTKQMIMPIYQLLAYCSQHFTLLPGDVVMTGTPAGVGVLNPGDALRFQLEDVLELQTEVQS